MNLTVPTEEARRVLATALRAHRAYIGEKVATSKNQALEAWTSEADALDAMLEQVDAPTERPASSLY